MACQKFFQALNLDPQKDDLDTVSRSLFEQGLGCVNENSNFCDQHCRDVVKTPQECYTCVDQTGTCPDEKCRSSTVDCTANPKDPCCLPESSQGACCPLAQMAIECSYCVNKNNSTGAQSRAAYLACTSPGAQSRTIIIVVVVVSVVVLVAVGLVVYVWRNHRHTRQAKQQLLQDLQAKGLVSSNTRAQDLQVDAEEAERLDAEVLTR